MCGIVGCVGKGLSYPEMEQKILAACRALRHRGPDDENYYLDEGIVFGVSRLAIRDPGSGIQPMKRQGRIIAFNGEIYETESLRKTLVNKGYVFETKGDTEVLLNAFIEFGPSILSQLIGMFAFAIWDSKNKRLCLARDRWGEKPLYYTSGEEYLAFASEIKGLKVWPNIEWEISLKDLPIFLKNSYLPGTKTGWKKIHKLEPGSFLIWQNGQTSITNYFDFEAKEEKAATQKNAEELYDSLHLSVKQCLVSDQPIGAFLSGGIDSTTVSYFLSKYLPSAPVFSLHWEDKTYSEEVYTTQVASAFNLTHFSVKCDVPFFLNYFDSIVELYDEPFADESMIPTFCLASFAKKKVDVILTGDGSDEFFHGYERYFFEGNFAHYLDVFSATSKKTLELICTPDFLSCALDDPFPAYYCQLQEMVSQERCRSLIDIKTYLTNDILTKVDRACMGVGLEPRAPFLSPQVTQFALSCNRESLTKNLQRGKEILRMAMENHLPQIVLQRKKMGFGMPLRQWFCSSLKQWMISRLKEGNILKTGWFSKEGIDGLIMEHIEGNHNHARTLLNLIVLESWLSRNWKL